MPSSKVYIFLFCIFTVKPTAFAAEYTPNFEQTDIKQFIQVVSKNLQVTIISDPNIKGTINVRSYHSLDEELYYQFFLNVLDVHGYAVISVDGGMLKVIPKKKAKISATPVLSESDEKLNGELITQVVTVKNVPVRELAPLLRQLSDQAGGGNIVAYEPANVFMITGSAARVKRLVDIIALVDRAGDEEVEVVNLQYAAATEVVKIIESMLGITTKGSKNNTVTSSKVYADERTNSIVISSDMKKRKRIITLIQRLDQERQTSGNIQVHYLKYAKAEELVSVLTDAVAGLKDGENKNTGQISNAAHSGLSIKAHESTNALVITANPEMQRSIKGVIEQLDIRRAQVLVEAIIVEVLEGDGMSLGVQMYSEKAGMVQFQNGQAPIGSVIAGLKQNQPNDDVTIASDDNALAQALGAATGAIIGIGDEGWGALVQAVETDSNSNVLSTPSITALDNEEAYFIVGDEVPIITGTSTGDNNSNPFQTVDRQEVGIKLTVTPQINDGTAIQLTIEQEVSSVSGTTGVDITISKREIKTTVMAENGDTIALGGLIDEDVQETMQKVPFLGDIPIIGKLFTSTSTSTRKRNLMVFIRPTIIRDARSMSALSKVKYNKIREYELLKREQGLSLLADDKLPVLPSWKELQAIQRSYKTQDVVHEMPNRETDKISD